jgi:hypothetical protein
MKHQIMFRQGDVFLTKVSTIPVDCKEEDLSKDSRLVLAYGEVTGHAHAIPRDPETKVLPVRAWSSGAERFIHVMEKTALKHEEHAPIPLEPGIYKVGNQVEYTPAEIRRIKVGNQVEYTPAEIRRIAD